MVMAPPAGQKRKRGDRPYSQEGNNDGSNRPSPHRPQTMNMAQQTQQQNVRGGRMGTRSYSRNSVGTPTSPVATSSVQPAAVKASNAASAVAQTNSTVPNPPKDQPISPSVAQPERPTAETMITPIATKPSTPSTYFYHYLTDERIQSWKTTGRSAVLEDLENADNERKTLTFGNVFQELVKATLEARLESEEAGSMVKDIIALETSSEDQDLTSLFLDSLSILTEFDSFNPRLRSLIAKTGIPSQRMRDELDVPLLVSLGLIRDTFSRMGVRKATNLLYRQSNYNLLREESEGYAKLLTDYFSIIYLSGHTEPAYIEDAVTKVKALIGAFDLDVGRVLDVTLDVFANSLVQGRRFIPIFLRMSPWWPERKPIEGLRIEYEEFAGVPYWVDSGSLRGLTDDEKKEKFAELKDLRDQKFWARVSEVGMHAWFELGGRRIIKDPNSKTQPDESLATELDESQDWVKVTGTAPPPGNRTAAQILGFKLRSYSKRWTIRDPANKLPENIPHLAALLIKIGFISLRDLYPHLLPSDEEMGPRLEKLKKKIIEEEVKSRAGNMSSLAMAKPLSDDEPVRPTRFKESTPKPDGPIDKPALQPKDAEKLAEEGEDPVDQKAALAKSLLLVGAIPDALYILGKHPVLMDAYAEMPRYIHRIIHHSISKLYSELTPIPGRTSLSCPKQQVVEQSKSGLHCTLPPPIRSIKWLEMDRETAVGGVVHQYFWEDWTDTVPVCQTIDDLFQLCNSLLNLSGVRIGQDPILLSKLARIGRHSMSVDFSEANVERWVDLCKRLLVPALSLSKLNVGVNREVWALLELLPIRTRFSVYSEWYKGPTSRLPEMRAAFDRTRYETNQILKRLSKENVDETAGKLTKVTGTCPGIVFEVALTQLEAYPNFINVVVQCAKHFSSITYDIMFWALVLFLGGRGKVQVQDDGMITSVWLQNLAKFTGSMLKAYYKVDSTPILQFLEYGIRKGDFVKLQVLEKVVEIVGGIEANVELNEQQTLAMAGGEILKTQTLRRLLDKRHERKAQSQSLTANLLRARLTGQLLIGIAQCRQHYLFSDDNKQEDNHGTKFEAPTKVLAMNFDKITDVLMQYLEFLKSNLSLKEFEAAIPDLVSLISEFGLEPSLAFTISRSSINFAMSEYNARAKLDGVEKLGHRRLSSSQQILDGDVDMAEVATKPSSSAPTTNGEASQSSATDTQPSKTGPDASEPPATAALSSDNVNGLQDILHPVLGDLVDRMRPVLPHDFEDSLSVAFYVRFWQLTLADMQVPAAAYTDEFKRLQSEIARISTDRSNITTAGVRERDRRKKEAMGLQDRLQVENKTRISEYSVLRRKLLKEKDHWFSSFPRSKHESVNSAILEHCFLPRIVLSPFDAFYTFKMLFFLHSTGTPGFFTMHLLNEFFREKQMAMIIYQCTTHEAKNLGRFLQDLLRELQRWHGSADLYDKLALGPKRDLPGFARKFGPDGLPHEVLVYEQYRTLLFKWHRNLSNALKASFSSPEFMHIQNALTILNAIQDHFPVVDFMGTQLRTVIDDVLKKEHRSDLKLSLGMLANALKAREKVWIIPQAFHTNAGAAKPDAANRAIQSKTGVSQSATDARNQFNTSPSEFKSRSGSNMNGRRIVPVSGSGGAEDGEIEDSRDGVDSMRSTPHPDGLGDKNADLGLAVTAPDAGTLVTGKQPYDRDTESNSQDYRQTPPATNGPPRPGYDRSSNQGNSNRAPHALPTRPEIPPGPHRGRMADGRDVQPERPGNRQSREYPQQDYGRLDRPVDVPRNGPLARNVSPGRHGGGGRSRSPIRAPQVERDMRRDTRERYEERPIRQGPMEPNRTEVRNPRWQAQEDGRQRSNSNSNMGPPSSNHPHERGSTLNPERAAIIGSHPSERSPHHASSHSERLPPVGHDRTGLVSERGSYIESRRGDDVRQDRDPRGSRPQSPRRYDERLRDDRRDDHGAPERISSHTRERREESFNSAPTGPRARHDLISQGGGSRELFQSGPPRQQPVDPNYGRLSQDFGSRSGESSYGRLNAPEPPSGPRASLGNRGSRNFTAPSPLSTQRNLGSPQHHPPSSPNHDRFPGAGSTNDRRDRREQGSGESGRTGETGRSGPNSAPQTPASEHESQELLGVHPSRLAALQTNAPPPPPPPPRHATSATAAAPPSGPRNTRQNPHAMPPSPSTRGPPTGPAVNDRSSASDRRFANIQNTLQGTAGNQGAQNDRGASIRGRANRMSNPNIQAHSMPQQGPVPPHMSHSRSDNLPQRPEGSMRPDLIHSRPGNLGGNGEFEQQDDHSHSEGRGTRTREGHRESRSQRHRSRSRSPRREERESSKREREEGKAASDEQRERERRSHRTDPEMRESRRGRDEGRESHRERAREGERREMRPREEHQRSGPRSEELMPQPRRGGGPQMEMDGPHWGMPDNRVSSNGDVRFRSGNDRRDDRERRDTRDMGGRKRVRGAEEGASNDPTKRPRRSQ